MCTKDNFRCPYEMIRKNKKSHVKKREVVFAKTFFVCTNEELFLRKHGLRKHTYPLKFLQMIIIFLQIFMNQILKIKK